MAAPAPPENKDAKPAPVTQVVTSYFWGYIIVGVIVAAVAIGSAVYYNKKSGFLVGQPRTDQQHDWSMSNEIKKLEERQRMALAKVGK